MCTPMELNSATEGSLGTYWVNYPDYSTSCDKVVMIVATEDGFVAEGVLEKGGGGMSLRAARMLDGFVSETMPWGPLCE